MKTAKELVGPCCQIIVSLLGTKTSLQEVERFIALIQAAAIEHAAELAEKVGQPVSKHPSQEDSFRQECCLEVAAALRKEASLIANI